MTTAFEIYLVATPGLESLLVAEAREKGFAVTGQSPGGVTLNGTWRDVWRANLELRGAGKVLARIGQFRAAHLAELDKRARQFPWQAVLRRDVAVHVEASCSHSKIYHSGAAAQRIATAIHEEHGAPVTKEADVIVKVRIERNICTLSIDTSGGLLHKRGHKEAMAKAPMRETMAAMFLRQCGYAGHETVVDPMCGSGTFVIEAAEIALGLAPGRGRIFAFEQLANFDAAAWAALKNKAAPIASDTKLFGYDRDAGAIAASTANAARAGVTALTTFRCQPISALEPPEGPPGLVICNPPYGARIGERKPLETLYASFGAVLRERFAGWRVGLIASDPKLAAKTGLALSKAGPPILHGGLRIHLFSSGINRGAA